MDSIETEFTVTFQHRVFFTHAVFNAANPLLIHLLSKSTTSGKILAFIDRSLVDAQPDLPDAINNYMRLASLPLVDQPIPLAGGEETKNQSRFLKLILDEIEQHSLCRHSLVLAIGGGAMLDVAGFAASIAHRGIRMMRLPSTTLAQADAGVGVKNGINYAGKKNFLGTFAPPFAVINDFALLESLPPTRKREGYSEAVKVALIRDAGFFDEIEQDAAALAEAHTGPMQRLIRRSAELHVRQIATAGDPFEMGSARPLDFGHWSAHKLEQVSRYSISHGAAVAAGMALDTVYSQLSGLLDEASRDRVLALLRRLGFDISPAEFLNCPNEILRGLEEFREHLGGTLTITLLAGIGHGVEVHTMDRTLILRAMKYLETV